MLYIYTFTGLFVRVFRQVQYTGYPAP